MTRRAWVWCAAAVVANASVVGASIASASVQPPAPTAWISRAYDGSAGDNISQSASISADGRWAAFASLATNLVEGDDANRVLDVFVRDMTTGTVALVSQNPGGQPAGGEVPEISADGRFVAFCSPGALVDLDTNGDFDVYLYRVKSGQLEIISKAWDGSPSEGGSCTPSISADGRFVAFESRASDLVPGAQNDGLDDIFVTKVGNGATVLASHTPAGGAATRDSNDPSLSGDGRYVSYHSYAPDLVNGDDNNTLDVLVYDRRADRNERASSAPDGTSGNKGSARASISQNGKFVAYHSAASDLVDGDTNNYTDVFRTSRRSGRTVLVTVDPDGGPINGQSINPSVSADGRYVTFSSDAPDHVPGLVLRDSTIFCRDLDEQVTTLVSQYADGSPTRFGAFDPNFGGGRITFSTGDALELGDTNEKWDVYHFHLY